MLSDTEKDESYIITKEGETMWEARKMYEADELTPNDTSLGLSVGIFQESIGKMTEEYLVSPAYLKKLLINYGFQPASKVDIKRWGLPNHSGSFEILFDQMEENVSTGALKKSQIKKSLEMSAEEKELSFMTRYFIFEKKLAVNAAEVFSAATGESVTGESAAQEEQENN